MKNAPFLFVCSLSIILNSSCALGMGQRRECIAPVIPTRPPENLCISNASGVGQCWNPVLQRNEVRSMENYVCKNISDYNRQEEWIEAVLNGINP